MNVSQTDTSRYLNKDPLRQEASQCQDVGGGAARQADVEVW